jgi:hypothetical protein
VCVTSVTGRTGRERGWTAFELNKDRLTPLSNASFPHAHVPGAGTSRRRPVPRRRCNNHEKGKQTKVMQCEPIPLLSLTQTAY